MERRMHWSSMGLAQSFSKALLMLVYGHRVKRWIDSICLSICFNVLFNKTLVPGRVAPVGLLATPENGLKVP